MEVSTHMGSYSGPENVYISACFSTALRIMEKTMFYLSPFFFKTFSSLFIGFKVSQ